MSVERTFLSLTLFQESAHVMVKPYKGLMYLCMRSIVIAQRVSQIRDETGKDTALSAPEWSHYALSQYFLLVCGVNI